VKWLPVAEPDNSSDAAPAGYFLAAGEGKLTGVPGTSQGDADDSTQMISASGHLASDNDGGTDFNSGEFSVAPGETEVGYVSFVVPDSQKVNTVGLTARSSSIAPRRPGRARTVSLTAREEAPALEHE
jgi:hypothetical protein